MYKRKFAIIYLLFVALVLFSAANAKSQDAEIEKIIKLDKTLVYLSKIEGQITIDETDKRIIKIEGFALGEYVAQKDKPEIERQKELVFLFTQTKVSEGFWFPQTIWLNFAKHPEIFEAIEIQFNFSSYKKSSVDVKDSIDSPKEPTGAATEEKQT